MATTKILETLTTDILHDEVVVRDDSGGVWWPDDETQEEIQRSANPEATALRICNEDPSRGEWRC